MALGILTLLVISPFIGSLIVYLTGLKSKKASTIISQLVAILTAVISWFVFALFDKTQEQLSLEENINWIPSLDINFSLAIDGISLVLILLSTTLVLLVSLQSIYMIKKDTHIYNALVLLIEGGIIGIFTSMNLVFFYIFWELVLIPMFFLIGRWGKENRKVTSITFFIFTHVGSVLMLISFMVTYAASGSFDIAYLMDHPLSENIQIIVGIGILIGALIKLPMIPLHIWQPEAYDQAPTPVSVLFAGLLAKMAGYALIRLGFGLTPFAIYHLRYVLIGLGIFGAFYSAFAAIKQRNLKKIVAYTSIAHMSLMVISLTVAVLFSAQAKNLTALNLVAEAVKYEHYSQMAIIGGIFLMISHGITIGSIFLLIGTIENHLGTEDVESLTGLKKIPFLRELLILNAVIIIGFPPFSGFISEMLVFFAVIPSTPWMLIIAFSLIIIAAIYIRLITRVLYRNKSKLNFEEKSKVTGQITTFQGSKKDFKIELIIDFVLFIPIIILGIFPNLLINVVAEAATYLSHMMTFNLI